MTHPKAAPGPLLSIVDELTGDPAKRGALLRMKRFALALLVSAAVVYALTYLANDGERGWVGYVRAAAEAGVVGGLADWFAVTALFRHPLGLPIPHTALIPTRKDALAGTLGEFVTGNFLTPKTLRPRLADARVVLRLGVWLTRPGTADRLTRQALGTVGVVRAALRAEAVADVLLDVVRRDAGRRSYAEVAGQLLHDFTDGGQHRPVLDATLPYLRQALADHREVVHDLLRSLINSNAGVLGLLVSGKRIHGVLDDAGRVLHAMEHDRQHPLRLALDDLLAKVADDLQHDPQLRAEVDSVVLRFLADPSTRDWWVTVAEGVLSAVELAVADPDGPFARAAARAITDLGRRTIEDTAFAARLEGLLEDAVVHVAEHYGQEFTLLVEQTVKGWDGADAADKIELAAGRDLQFIRINGTVVGALAGVAIHTVALALG